VLFKKENGKKGDRSQNNKKMPNQNEKITKSYSLSPLGRGLGLGA